MKITKFDILNYNGTAKQFSSVVNECIRCINNNEDIDESSVYRIVLHTLSKKAPSIPKTKNDLSWVSQAVSKDKIRPVFSVVYYIDELGTVASNGRIMLVHEDNLIDGNYAFDGKLFFNEDEFTEKYGTAPNFKQIVPQKTREVFIKEVDHNNIEEIKFNVRYSEDIGNKFSEEPDESEECFDVVLNRTYWMTCTNGLKNPKFYSKGEHCPIMIKENKKMALIMPIRTS